MGKKKMKKHGIEMSRTFADDLFALEMGLKGAGEYIFGSGKKKGRKDKTVYKDRQTEKEFRRGAKNDIRSQIQNAMDEVDDTDDIWVSDEEPTLRRVPKKRRTAKAFADSIVEEENKYAAPDEYENTYYGDEIDEDDEEDEREYFKSKYFDEDEDDEEAGYYEDATPEKVERVVENDEVLKEMDPEELKTPFKKPVTLIGMVEKETYGLNISLNTDFGRVVFNDGFAPYTIAIDDCKDMVDFSKIDMNADLPIMPSILSLYITLCSHPMAIMPMEDFLMRMKDVQEYNADKFSFFLHNDMIYMYYISEENSYTLQEIEEYYKMTPGDVLEFYTSTAIVAGTVNNMFPGDNEEYVQKFMRSYNMVEEFFNLFFNDRGTTLSKSKVIIQEKLLRQLDVVDASSVCNTASDIIDKILVVDDEEEKETGVPNSYPDEGEEVEDSSFDLDYEGESNEKEETPQTPLNTTRVDQSGMRIGFPQKPEPQRPVEPEPDIEIIEKDPSEVNLDDIENDPYFNPSDDVIAKLKESMSGVRETHYKETYTTPKEEVTKEVDEVRKKFKSVGQTSDMAPTQNQPNDGSMKMQILRPNNK